MKDIEISKMGRETIQRIFNVEGTYSVTSFQRDYSWDEERWSDLYDDISNSLNENREHFFGFMTFLKERNSKETQIIEGQQRLATITILAAAVRDLLFEKQNVGWEKIDGSLIKPTHPWHPRKESYYKLILSETNRDFFKEYIQTVGNPNKKLESMRKEKKQNLSNRLIHKCYGFFHSKLIDKSTDQLLDFLSKATDDFIVIVSEVGNPDTAYILFETLNDRGLDLTLSDLLKTHLLRTAGDPNDHDWKEIKREWDEIKTLPEIKKMDEFVRHYWLSAEGTASKDELFSKLKNKIKNRTDAKTLSATLRKEAIIYSRLVNPEPSDFDGDAKIPQMLNELYVLSEQQVLPLLLSIVQSKAFKKKDIAEVIASLTNFVFRYLTIGEKENKKLESLFSDISRKIRNDEINDVASIIRELKKEYVGDDAFVLGFSEKSIRDPARAKYILRKIEDCLGGPEKTPRLDITLEHILPRNPDADGKEYLIENNLWDDKDEWVNRIGNLTLLTSEDNNKLKNKSPMLKSSEVYSKSKLELNKDLRNLFLWTSENIEQRQQKLAICAVQIWRL